MRRPDPTAITVDPTDRALTSFGGLIGFAAFLRRLGIDRELSRRYSRLKAGRNVVYPMGTQPGFRA